MKNIESNLKRFVKFGDIEIKPFENIVEDDTIKELQKNKIFNFYVKNGDFKVKDIDNDDGNQDIEDSENKSDYSDFIDLSIDQLKEKYTVDQLKAICKELNLRGYKDLLEDELIEKIINKVK